MMFNLYARIVTGLRYTEGLPLLLLRLYLTPVLLQAGWNKYLNFADTVAWFGDMEYGLGLPFPTLLAALAIAAEIGGSLLLLFGLFTRLAAFSLAITMLVAMVTVHAKNGWLAIADASSWLADGTLWHSERILAAPEKLQRARDLLQQHGNYDWLTESGNLVVLNNGIEFAATYFIMLLCLLWFGGGRYMSVDFYLARVLENKNRQ
jgi:putative oxidoreductase